MAFETLANSITTAVQDVMDTHSYAARYPNDPRATPTSGLFCVVGIDFGTDDQKEIGIDSFRNVGNLVIQIKNDIDLGINSLLVAADNIATEFRATTVASTIIFKVPRIVEVGRVDDNYQVNVICPFHYDYNS